VVSYQGPTAACRLHKKVGCPECRIHYPYELQAEQERQRQVSAARKESWDTTLKLVKYCLPSAMVCYLVVRGNGTIYEAVGVATYPAIVVVAWTYLTDLRAKIHDAAVRNEAGPYVDPWYSVYLLWAAAVIATLGFFAAVAVDWALRLAFSYAR